MLHKFPAFTILVASLILVAVLLPASALSAAPRIPGLDKLVHFALFFALAVAVRFDFGLGSWRRFALALVAALAFSALTEALQLLADGRSAGFLDMVADMAGFAAGLMARRRSPGASTWT